LNKSCGFIGASEFFCRYYFSTKSRTLLRSRNLGDNAKMQIAALNAVFSADFEASRIAVSGELRLLQATAQP